MNAFDHKRGSEVEIDGARLYFETHGAPSAPALVFLHGGLGTIEGFNVLLPRLTETFHVVGIDTRGHGRSTLGDRELSYALLAQDAWRVIDHLGLQSISLVGFSDGGIAAYRLAARKDPKIRRLVTIGARAALQPGAAAIFRKTTASGWQEKFPATYEIYQRLNPTPDFGRLVPAVVAMWLNSNPSNYPLEQLSAITCPTLVVRGDDDHLTAREEIFDYVRRIPKAKLSNLPFAGHVAFQEQTDAFMPGLNRFLSEA
ncbi:MAG: alpha/beta fold hydrolase [Verrucomicrobia bacterium]|nr:alpha/beta fold hydrolase [Verrucomicrobiota bacterium]